MSPAKSKAGKSLGEMSRLWGLAILAVLGFELSIMAYIWKGGEKNQILSSTVEDVEKLKTDREVVKGQIVEFGKDIVVFKNDMRNVKNNMVEMKSQTEKDLTYIKNQMNVIFGKVNQITRIPGG